MGEIILKAVGIIFIGIVVVFFLSFLVAFPVMWLWNWVIPDIFGLSPIGYWQAFGLNLLCGILFKSTSSSSSKS